MSGNTDDGVSSIAIERYKLYFERKKYLYEVCKFLLWISTTLIAVNVASIGTGKFAGSIETNVLLQNVISYVSIMFLFFVISRLLIVCVVTASHVWSCKEVEYEEHCNEGKWLCEVRSMTASEIFCIKNIYSHIKRSIFIIIALLFASTVPIAIHFSPLDRYFVFQ